MDTKIPPPSPPPSAASDGGAEKFLSDLPSRGFFSSSPTIPSSTFGSMRVYICEHDTSPPETQLIKTDQMNILIRSLLLKKRNSDSSSAASRKRLPERPGEGSSGKRPAIGDSGEREALQCLTVERLRIMLREKGLNVKGKKDELIARLRAVNG